MLLAYVPNVLILPEFDLYEALKIDDPKKVEWKQYLVYLQNRDLRGAYLVRAILPKADLRGTQLQGGMLRFTQLQGANFSKAQLQGANLSGAKLQANSFELT